MGFFDSISGFFGGGGSGVGSLVGAAASLGGALIGSKANKDAARTVSQSQAQAAQTAADAYLRGAEIMAEGNKQAQARLQPLADTSAPAINYLRTVMAQDPATLTPSQETLRADLTRRANTQLASSGLRGSGRAVTASINDVDRRFRDDAYDQNLHRADQAAGKLAGTYTSTLGDIADIDRRTSEGRAQAVQRGGDAFAGATRAGGEAAAGADVANANQWGSAMGMISSLLAQDRKERTGAYPVGQNIKWDSPRYSDTYAGTSDYYA
jgi:hypothetical protein